MKTAFYSLLLGVLSLGSLAGCEEDAASSPRPEGKGLVGTWRLTSRQCYCPQAPVPNETVTFTATDVVFHRNGQLLSQGSYDFTTGGLCGSNASGPLLRFSYTLPSQPTATRLAIVTENGNTLVLDYGGPCDGPVDRYERM